MDITLVRQAKQKTEIVKEKEIKYIDTSAISDLSKASLRILYECGNRPLYSFSDSGSNKPLISVISSPQKEPDCLLCSEEKNSFQSASVLKEQISDVGVDFPVVKLAALSNTSQDAVKRRLCLRALRQKLQSLEKSGHQHVVIVANEMKLADIYRMLTKEKLPERDEQSTCVWGIRNGQLSYIYNSQKVDYVTEGLLDSELVTMINKTNCPQSLIKFHGKVKKPIDQYTLFYKFRQQKHS